MLRLYISYIIPDARAKVKKTQFEGALGPKSKLGAVYLADCYTIDAKLDKKQTEKAKSLLVNILSQKAVTDNGLRVTRGFSYAIEIGFLAGVTDNPGNTAKETLRDGARVKFKPGQNVYSSQVVFINGDVSSADISTIADSLYNPLIQRATITDYKDFQKTGLKIILPKVKITGSGKVTKVDLNVDDDELAALGKFGISNNTYHRRHSEGVQPTEESLSKNKQILRSAQDDAGTRRGPLALSLEELKAIRDYFNSADRKPTDVELEALAQTWSEHCKHTIFSDPLDELKNGIYKTYIKAATEKIRKQKGKNDFCVSVFTDNAGGISFDENYIISHKVETHNTPSALDPFGGSITGIVGVNRDSIGFGLGSKPVANFYGFCLADPEDKTQLFRDKDLKNPMLSARRIMDGVIAGINAGGNQSGTPTPLGFLYFDKRFRGKPLVFAGTMGLTPKKIGAKKGWEKQAKAGDLIVAVGGRVGADGIHGATFSSEGLDSHSPATAVQIGDPITQKKFSDAIVKEARGLGLYNSITDCGAGGLSSAVGEMAKDSNGCEVNLDKVPLKYPGLAPWQIWISESQERMVLAVAKNKWKKFYELMKKRGTEAAVIGKFTADGRCVARYGKRTVLDIKMEFLHNGRPKKHLKTESPVGVILRSAADGGSLQSLRDSSAMMNSSDGLRMTPKMRGLNLTSVILNLLSSLNISSTEFVSRQYDHEVQGSSVLKPLQGRGQVNSEAAIFRPVLFSQKGVVTSFGLHPELSEINPYQMAACSIDAAIRGAVAAGANVDYLALLDNFCWCSPDDPKRLWQLKEAARACHDYAVAFGTPFISGKDSMHNDFKGYGPAGKPLKIFIPPTLLITTVGVIPDASKAVSLDAKLPGDLLYILGETNGASGVNAQKNLALYRSFYRVAQKNLVVSSISVNRGGLTVALAKKLIGGGLGADVDISKLSDDSYQTLFSENPGRILVSVDPKKSSKFELLMNGRAFAKIGRITAKPNLKIAGKNNKTIVNIKLAQAEKSYKSRFKNY